MAGLEMWFRDDVAKLLASVMVAQTRIMAYVPPTSEALAYCAGCADTLAALATAFGLPPMLDDTRRIPQP